MSSSVAESDSICVSCGLCCDGTIFGHLALIDDDDRQVLHSVGVTLIRKDDRDVVVLPCPALDVTRCTVYEVRPQICRDFRCQLLQDHDAGEVDTAAALEIIGATLRLRDRVRVAVDAYLGPADGPAGLEDRMLAARAKIAAGPDPEAEESAQTMTLMAMVALRQRIRRSFASE